MKIKRTLSLLLSLVLLVGILCGCGGNPMSYDDDDDDDRPSSSRPKKDPSDETDDPTDSNTPTNPSAPDDPTTPSDDPIQTVNKIEMSRISGYDVYSEGLALVRLDGNRDTTYCINKQGEIIFTLDGFYSGTFLNGLAFVKNGYGDILICDTTGNLTNCEDLGITSFVAYSSYYGYYWFGDYIVVQISSSTYTGPIEKIGIMNSKLEYVVQPSESLYEVFQKYINSGFVYENYLIKASGTNWVNSSILDLSTGTEVQDVQTIINSISSPYESDFWDTARYDYKYIHIKTGETVLDLEEYDTISSIGDFQNGTAPIIFEATSNAGTKEYFTLIKENGTFCFEPIELPSTRYFVKTDGDKYLLYNKKNDWNMIETTLVMFDQSGMICQLPLEDSGTRYIDFADSVIHVKSDDNIIFYDLDLTPLF